MNTLDLFAEFLEKQDLLSKLTESEKLHGYGYSDIHTLVAIQEMDHANVTKIAHHMHMTRGAISKIIKRLTNAQCITSYSKESNKKEIYFSLTSNGQELYDEHEKRHQLWLKRDQDFLNQHSEIELKKIEEFMIHYNSYLEDQIQSLGGK